jgi:dinuclear metal center YbgI/SA1388 family protein
MKIKEIVKYLEQLAPKAYQESYDNAGLITGSMEMELKGTMTCLDSTEDVIDEAIAKGVNLVIAHHPIIFSGLKQLNGKNYVERTVIKAIKHDIAIYAIHTNLDNVRGGVNDEIADRIGLLQKGRSILMP